MSGDAETLAEYGGLTHHCDDANCHIPGFIHTLTNHRDAAIRAEALEDAADVTPANIPNPRSFRDWLRARAAALRAAQPTEGES